jgi:hypothetical protein
LDEQANLLATDAWIQHEFGGIEHTRRVDVPFLQEVNERLLRNVIIGPDTPCISGTFRKIQVEVRTPHGTHYPPGPERIPPLLDSHFGWLEVLKVRQIPPLQRAMHLAVAVCAIHPFMEGNGRTARMASLALILLEGYRYRRERTWEEYLEAERKRWTVGMWLAVRGNPGLLSALFSEAVSALMLKTSAPAAPAS